MKWSWQDEYNKDKQNLSSHLRAITVKLSQQSKKWDFLTRFETYSFILL